MKQGIKNVQELYKELEEQRENRKDMIADTRSLVVNSTDGISTLSVSTGNDVISYSVSDVAHKQIADRLGIPFKYYERMRLSFFTSVWMNAPKFFTFFYVPFKKVHVPPPTQFHI